MKKQISDTAKVLGDLAQGELSAVETYRQAIGKVAEEPAAGELRRIESEHVEAASLLKTKCTQFGYEVTSSGAWGSWAKAVEGTATLLGSMAAIKALKEGEEHGVKEYESALEDDTLPEDIRQLISAELLPQTREHIPVLDRFLAGD